MSRCPVIAIAGGSASGKSTLIHHLHNSLEHPSVILSLDCYYHDLSHLPDDERANTNFDHPDALDINLYVDHLNTFASHNPVKVPVYDFASHTRINEKNIQPQSIILTEGIQLLAIKEIRDCIDFSVFLDVPEEIRLERKIKRDIKERGRTEEYAIHQFTTTVKPIHDELITPSMQFADLILDGTSPGDELMMEILPKLNLLIQ